MYFVSTLLSCTFRGKNINAYKKRNTPNDKTNTNVNIMNLHLSYGDIGKLDKYPEHLKPTSLRVILGVSQELLSSQSLSLPILHPHVVFLCHPMLSSVLLTVFAKNILTLIISRGWVVFVELSQIPSTFPIPFISVSLFSMLTVHFRIKMTKCLIRKVGKHNLW